MKKEDICENRRGRGEIREWKEGIYEMREGVKI